MRGLEVTALILYNTVMEFLKQHKNDLLLILAILLLAGGIRAYTRLTRRGGGSVTVAVDGVTVASFPLNTDRAWTWTGATGSNTLVIEDGAARVTEADCPDRLCVRQGAIRYAGESIVCLPHSLVVTVADGDENGLDAVAR